MLREAMKVVPVEIRLGVGTGGMDAAHDRANGDALGLGDLLVAHPRLGEQDERAPDRGSQPAEGLVESPPEVLLVQPPCGVVGRRVVTVLRILASLKTRTPLASSSPVERGVGHDLQPPGPERAATVELAQGG